MRRAPLRRGLFSCRVTAARPFPQATDHGRDMSQARESFTDYGGFVEKFKPKRTTDDCYTPP